MDGFIDVIVPLGMVAGTFYLFGKIMKLCSSPPYDEDDEELEQEEEPKPLEISPQTIASEIRAKQNHVIYGRLKGDIERATYLQGKINETERAITAVNAHCYWANEKAEKHLLLSTGDYNGEQIDIDINLFEDDAEREKLLETLYIRRDRLRASLLETVGKISGYGVTETETETISDSQYLQLKNIVDKVLKEAQDA